MTVIIVDRVTKKFVQGDKGTGQPAVAVDDVSLKVHSGETLALLGPSGCGKTTLLRLIAGLETPDSGDILYDNVPLSEIPHEDRGVGMVFQEDALMPHWVSRLNIDFFLRLRKREDELPERLLRISEITGIDLDLLLDRFPDQLSGGEKQRVSIARALARDLEILLCDEPFASLDAGYRSKARLELKRLLAEFSVTTVYVTHDQLEAMALADRIAVMNAGKIEQIGTYRQLYDTPQSLFVATFIGAPTINLFAGEVVGGEWQGENFGGFPIRHDLRSGSPITMGVRPEHMHLTPDGVPGVVDEVTKFFSERHQLVDVHLGEEQWSLQIPLDHAVHIGDTIYSIIDPTGLLYFDPATGKRIG
jgi:ABC-type sugar transport system ATPase subunit